MVDRVPLATSVSVFASRLGSPARTLTSLPSVQVKSNIFELLADLAWSFSDMQLDSLFNRFERSKVIFRRKLYSRSERDEEEVQSSLLSSGLAPCFLPKV